LACGSEFSIRIGRIGRKLNANRLANGAAAESGVALLSNSIARRMLN
jgi:hypothetical protein